MLTRESLGSMESLLCLELVVDPQLAALGKSILISVIVIAEIVAVAGRHEGKSKGVVRR